jgi:hypothetical protein
VVKSPPTFAHIVRIKFQTRVQLPGLSLKLRSRNFFFTFWKLQVSGPSFKLGPVHLEPSFKLGPNILLLYNTPSTFLLHLPSASHFFKIVIVTVARASNWKILFFDRSRADPYSPFSSHQRCKFFFYLDY